MGRPPKHRSPFSITLPNELGERVRELANRDGRTVSDVIEECIQRTIGDAEQASEIRRDPLLDRLVERLTAPDQVAKVARALRGEEDARSVLGGRLRETAKRKGGK